MSASRAAQASEVLVFLKIQAFSKNLPSSKKNSKNLTLEL